MIAKAKAVAHGGNLIRYAMKERKMDRMIAGNLVSALTPQEIYGEFERVNRVNARCENKYLRFEIGIAPQDEPKMTPEVLHDIVCRFAQRMNLKDHQ
ncbi:MAG: hypothetical protein EGP73_07475 [Alistipes indistinctus]|nr:hypothetical protein [Alistipes indistinctus]MBD9134686.1 hypothetical protein [Alistipes indistinctus]